MKRILEPEIMDSEQEAIEYDAMDFIEINTDFAQKAIEITPTIAKVLDIGTGTARIPIIAAQKRPQWQIMGIDLAQSMLDLGRKNIQQIGLETQIKLDLIDAKKMPYQNEEFDLVMSNSLVHHLPEALAFFQEIKRVVKTNGGILIRDLFRPENEKIREEIVGTYAKDCTPHQKKLFRDSLQAAFTLEEIQELVEIVGLERVKLEQSSDRHWTLERKFSY